MSLRSVVHYKDLEHDKPVVERLVSENLNGKLDAYLKKFEEKPENFSELWLEGKDGRFSGKIVVSLGNKTYRYSREAYRKLDDLVNHLFDHLKADLSKEPTHREADLRRAAAVVPEEVAIAAAA